MKALLVCSLGVLTTAWVAHSPPPPPVAQRSVRLRATIEPPAEVFDAHRLRLVVARMGMCPSETELATLMARIDSDHDGEISFAEFVAFVTQQSSDDASSLVGRLRDALRDRTRFAEAVSSADFVVNLPFRSNGIVGTQGNAISYEPDAASEAATPEEATPEPEEEDHLESRSSSSERERRRRRGLSSDFALSAAVPAQQQQRHRQQTPSEPPPPAEKKAAPPLSSTALLSEFEEMSRVHHDTGVVVGGVKPAYTSSSRTGYDARDWSRVLRTWPSSFVVRRIRSPLVAISLWSLVVACLHQVLVSTSVVTSVLGTLGATAPGVGIARTMTLAGSALSLLLVFRTNTAYNRYAEGRKVWQGICAATRDCAEFCAAYVPEIGEARVRRIADLLVAFPLTLILYLQGQRIPPEPRLALEQAFAGVLKAHEERHHASAGHGLDNGDDVLCGGPVGTTTTHGRPWGRMVARFLQTTPRDGKSRGLHKQNFLSSSARAYERSKNLVDDYSLTSWSKGVDGQSTGDEPVLTVKKTKKKRRKRSNVASSSRDFFSWSTLDDQHSEDIPFSLVENAARTPRRTTVGPKVPLETFIACCRADESLAACFSLPSDVEPDVALAQLHQLKFGRKRPANGPVAMSELEAYYNPLALARLLTPQDRARLARSRCPPLDIARQLTREAKAVPYDDELFSSRERMALIGLVGKLRHAVGSAERIAQTPVPLHYARHALRFLSLWSLALPLALVNQLGFLTVPATAFIVWALFGLREIGTLIENPFSRPLQLQIVSDTLMIDVREAVDSIDQNLSAGAGGHR